MTTSVILMLLAIFTELSIYFTDFICKVEN